MLHAIRFLSAQKNGKFTSISQEGVVVFLPNADKLPEFFRRETQQ